VIPSIETPEGRRGWALIALVGGAMTFTLFAAVAVWMLRSSAGFIFWLALAAHLHVLVCLTGLSALLVKRSYKVSRDSIEINDGSEP
jgi:apolipoprotein N-acyltransferase